MTVSRTPPACPPQPPEAAVQADAAGFPRRRLLRAAPALLLGPWLAARSPAAHADMIETANVRLEPNFEGDGWALSADFAIPLSSRIEDAVNRGVPLYFVVEFELSRPRWYWWDDKVIQAGQTYRLSYHALTRQYRVSLNGYQQQYPNLADAVRTMSLLRGWKVIAADQVSAWRRWERAVQDSVTRGFALGSPLAEAATPRLVRVVIGTEGLREKLVLWQHGLDDGLVECAKLRLVAGQPARAAPGAALVVDAVTADGGLAVDWWPAPAGPPARRLVLTVDDLAACDRDRAALRARFPELFAGGLVGLMRTGILG